MIFNAHNRTSGDAANSLFPSIGACTPFDTGEPELFPPSPRPKHPLPRKN